MSEADLSKKNWNVKYTVIYYTAIACLIVTLGFVYSTVLAAILVALFAAYLVSPGFEKRYANSRFRLLGAVSYMLGLIFTSVIIVSILVPVIVRQANILFQYFPGTLNLLKEQYYPRIQTLLSYIGIKDINTVHLDELMNLDKISEYTQTGISNIWQISGSILGWLVNVNLMPILFGFFLFYWKDILQFVEKFTPYPVKFKQQSYLEKIDRTIREIIKGQIMVAAVMGCLYAIGFSVIGLKAGALIGLICGICRIVPYVDIVVALCLSAISILQNSSSPTMFLAAAIVIIVVQAIDGALLTPKIVGGRVGVHPILVIISILAFGDRFGVWGVILAIPFIAVLRVSWEFIVIPYQAWLSKYHELH